MTFFPIKDMPIVTIFIKSNVIILILATVTKCHEFVYYDILFLKDMPIVTVFIKLNDIVLILTTIIKCHEFIYYDIFFTVYSSITIFLLQ